jgi:hypothetical protein
LKIRVLDSWPVLEWIKGTQPVTDIVADLLVDAGSGIARLLMSAINVGEVYYFVRKYQGETLAESWRQSSGTLPITIEVPIADEIWDAASSKAVEEQPRMNTDGTDFSCTISRNELDPCSSA